MDSGATNAKLPVEETAAEEEEAPPLGAGKARWAGDVFES
jgi:hypothetical protein